MLQKERFDQIYAILEQRSSATVQYLQKRLYVSEATVRRDLDAMEKAGLIHRVWGGAMISASPEKDIPSFVRDRTNSAEKAKIAAIASKLLRENSSIFIDSSTSCHHLVPFLAKYKRLTVITSSLAMQRLLSEHTNVNVHLLGGQVFEKGIITGHLAVASVRQYNAGMMFFSCSGISAEKGLSSIEARVVEVSRAMMRQAETKVLLCDSSKVDKQGVWHLADIEEVDYIIMDKKPDDPALLAAIGPRLITDKEQLAGI